MNKLPAVEITVTIKNNESYQTTDMQFESKQTYYDWLKSMRENHSNGKIIGIHREQFNN